VFRYATAACPLPPELHAATRACTLAEITAVAGSVGASVCRLRSPKERVAELGLEDGEPLDPPWALRSLTRDAPARRRFAAAADGDPPLVGLRIVEAGRRIQGPLAGHVLGLLGATVMRIEPRGGDLLRGMPPLVGDCSARFLALNRGKEVVEVDLKDPADRARLLDLVADADVFLHNWAPGKATQLGLDAEEVAARNSRIVYAHASGWGAALGADPPLGTDFMVQAYAGLGEALNPPGELPYPSLMTLLDILGALVAAEGVLAGLLLRERTNQAQQVDTSLLSAATVLQADLLDAIASGCAQHRSGGQPLWTALDQPLPTAAGLLALSVGSRAQFERLCTVAGVDADGDRATVEAAVSARLCTRPAEVWEATLRRAGIPAAAVCTSLDELARDRRFIPVLDHDGCAFVRSPWRFGV
jgi:CoA:oxalate CoA-transferase